MRATDTDIFLLRACSTLMLNSATKTWCVGPTRAVLRQEDSYIANQNTDALCNGWKVLMENLRHAILIK